MSRGFFSGFVAIMGVLLLIALFYAQSTRDDGVSQTDELLIGHSLLNRDWALARNAYSQFASDAIAAQIEASASCSVPTDFAASIGTYWAAVQSHLYTTYGIDCVASIDAVHQSDMGSSFPDQVRDNLPAYALLTCERTIAGKKNTLQHPFVIWKDVQVNSLTSTTCEASVYDMLGAAAYTPPLSDVALEVQVQFTHS